MSAHSIETRVKWWGRGLFILSLLLYVGTLSPGFFPGHSAALVASHLGLHAFPATMHHVWGWIIAGIAAIPAGSLPIRVHAVGALCAAASVWLLFRIVASLKRDRRFEEGMPRHAAENVRLFTAIFAAALLALSPTFWIAATRAHPLGLSLLMMLAAFYLLLQFGQDGRFSRLYASVVLYAVGMTNYASLLLYVPIYGFLVLVYLYRHGRLDFRTTFKLFAVALIGAVPLLAAALLYRLSDAFVWREFSHVGQVLWYMLLDQYRLVLRAMPRVGWLTVAVGSLLPWVAVYGLGISRRSLSAGTWFGNGLLCALLVALGVVLMLDLKISPWALAGDYPLLITPYVMIAMWMASIAGFWLAYCRGDRGGARRVAATIWMVLCIGFLALIGVRNARIAGGTDGLHFARFARETMDRIGDRAYLISGSPFDDLLLLEARARGKPLSVINLRHSQSLAYRRYVANIFDDPRLKSLALVNLQPMLLEWFARDPDIDSRVAVLEIADIWMAAQRIPKPRGVLYDGHAPDEPLDAVALASDNRAFWSAFAGPAAERRWPDRHPAAAPVRAMLAQTAKSANNLGVLFEETGHPELAEDAYRHALRYHTNNISAMVNLHALLKRQDREEAVDLEKRIENIISLENVRRQLWSLSYHHGIIRSPELYAARGWAWAMSGKPSLAAENIKQAIDLGGENAALRLALAALDAAQEGESGSESVLQAELERNPTNRVAAIGLYQLALRRGDFAVARGRLNQLREMNVSADFLQTEEALLDAISGDPNRAAELLSDIVKRDPNNLRAWAALAVIAGERQDAKTVREALDQLQQAKRATPAVRFMAAQLAMRAGDRAAARRQLEQILQQEPRHVPAMEMMIRLAMLERDRETAEAWVDRLVSSDPRNAFGNYLLGALQVMRGQFPLAESSYRVSLESRRTPEALNDLAYVLARLNRPEEALPLIEECLQRTDLNGAAWHTYGVVLMAMNRLDEAETALLKALAARPESAEAQLNLARVMERTGRRAEALKLAEALISRSGELMRDDQDGLRELLRRLRSG